MEPTFDLRQRSARAAASAGELRVASPRGTFITSIHVDVPAGTRHAALPSDLYALTVYCHDGLACAEDGEDFVPEVTLTALRTRPGRFVSGGRGELALVLLTPEAAIAVLRAPVHGLHDRRVPLEQLCGALEQRRLRDSLRLAATRADRVERLGRWLEERMTARRPLGESQRRVSQAANLVLHGEPAAETDRISSTLGVSRRQLERDFHQWLGVSPSHFARLARFQRAARAVSDGAPLVDVALDAGYADQPHFTRSVRKLAGMTPRELQRASLTQTRLRVQQTLAERLLINSTHDVVLDAASPTSPSCPHGHLVARASPRS